MSFRIPRRRAGGAGLVVMLAAAVGFLAWRGVSNGQNQAPAGQTPPVPTAPAAPTAPATAPSAEAAKSEAAADQTQPSFKLQVERNLVTVRVVVRDAKGEIVRDLHKEDFQLFDNGKPQAIAHFSIEGPGSKAAAQKAAPEPETEPGKQAEPGEPRRAAGPPSRFMALFFDDVHAGFEDLWRTRDAADHYLAGSILPSDRVGVFTASGQNNLEFTADRDKIHEALLRLRPHPVISPRQGACPEIFDYQAYLIVHVRDPYAIDIATEEYFHCNCEQLGAGQDQCRTSGHAQAEGEAVNILNGAEYQAEYPLRGLEQLSRRMAALPGQRSIVFVSPGFLTLTLRSRIDDIIDHALRASVVINTLDAQGLFAFVPYGDATQQPRLIPGRPDLMGQKSLLLISRAEQASDVLAELASATGGVFFHNSNDYDGGFRRVGSLPEVYYVLGFSPKNLKYDGHFHPLKVSLAAPRGLTLQARRGYFAPRQAPDDAAKAKEDIEQAVFSQDEMNELPVKMRMQFFKTSEQDAKLSVLTHLDLRLMPFRKQQGRNLDNLTIVTALFDRDGKYLTASEKKLEFRLLDGSLERYSRSGVTMKTSFDVKPGTYMVRQVVRDAQGGQISGLSRSIEIPF